MGTIEAVSPRGQIREDIGRCGRHWQDHAALGEAGIHRNAAPDDLDAAHRLLDLDLQWAGPGVTLDQRQKKLLFQIALAQWSTIGCVYGDRAIVLKATGELIGICGFRPWICTAAERSQFGLRGDDGHPFNTPEMGVGYALSSRHRGQGYAAEAVRALLEYAFRELKVRRVVALAERENVNSANLMARVGMTVGINPDGEAVYPWAVGMIENNLDGGG